MRGLVFINIHSKRTHIFQSVPANDGAGSRVRRRDTGTMTSSAGYAPGWLADYATVASALKANYAALGPFEASDVVIGIKYLRDVERAKRAEADPDEIHRSDAEGVLGPGPDASELMDLRKLCVAVEASYLEDRVSVANAIAHLGHVVVVSKPESKFQKPAIS